MEKDANEDGKYINEIPQSERVILSYFTKIFLAPKTNLKLGVDEVAVLAVAEGNEEGRSLLTRHYTIKLVSLFVDNNCKITLWGLNIASKSTS